MSTKIVIKTTDRVVPMIYAYTTPEIARHNGWTKIGYTEQDDIEDRIRQQLQTAHIPHHTEWSDVAVFADGRTYFRDSDFHAYLKKLGIERMKPDGTNVSLKVIGIFDEDGNAQESAPHPKQMLHVVFDGETEPQDILRRQEPDEKQ